jgi:hypothetical protein
MDSIAIERLIKISIDNPLMPETYVPWNNKLQDNEHVLPDHLVSLHGLEEFDGLTKQQLDEIRQHEVVQFMYSYAWGEGLLNAFLTRQIYNMPPESAEFRFIIREVIEESRHQEMFLRAIRELNGDPLPPTRAHSFWGRFASKWFPGPWFFLVAISSELVADEYGRHVQNDPKMYSVLHKIAELHQIEEGRHITFAKKYLEQHFTGAGFVRRSVYSIIMALNIYFLRTMYVRAAIFERAGVKNADAVFKKAKKHYSGKFAGYCLESSVEFAKQMNGINWLTRPLWNRLLKTNLK